MGDLGNLAYMLWILLFFLPPILITAWLVVSIVRFVATPKENTELRKKRKRAIIIPAIIFSVMVGAIVAFMITLSLAITHM